MDPTRSLVTHSNSKHKQKPLVQKNTPLDDREEVKSFMRFMFPLAMIFLALGLAGCVDKFVYPSARFTVTGVTPDRILLASATTIVLPGTSIALRSDFSIPSNLQSFSVTYTTRLGQPIPEIAIPETILNLLIAGGATTNIAMNPYTRRVFELLDGTQADISPLNATMHLTIKDVNGNTTQIGANCLLYALWDEGK